MLASLLPMGTLVTAYLNINLQNSFYRTIERKKNMNKQSKYNIIMQLVFHGKLF